MRWLVFAFDWERFAAIEPLLQAACACGDFSNLGIGGLDEIATALDENATPTELANVLAIELCARGQGVEITDQALRSVRHLRGLPDAWEASECLTELLFAAPNVPAWLRCDRGVAGLLTHEQTRKLAKHVCCEPRVASQRPSRRGLARLFGLLSTSDGEPGTVAELIETIRTAADARNGLAAATTR